MFTLYNKISKGHLNWVQFIGIEIWNIWYEVWENGFKKTHVPVGHCIAILSPTEIVNKKFNYSSISFIVINEYSLFTMSKKTY